MVLTGAIFFKLVRIRSYIKSRASLANKKSMWFQRSCGTRRYSTELGKSWFSRETPYKRRNATSVSFRIETSTQGTANKSFDVASWKLLFFTDSRLFSTSLRKERTKVYGLADTQRYRSPWSNCP